VHAANRTGCPAEPRKLSVEAPARCLVAESSPADRESSLVEDRNRPVDPARRLLDRRILLVDRRISLVEQRILLVEQRIFLLDHEGGVGGCKRRESLPIRSCERAKRYAEGRVLHAFVSPSAPSGEFCGTEHANARRLARGPRVVSSELIL
jgi:hypothetical protein